MEIKVTEKEENPLLNREEVNFEVDHKNEPTPPRTDVLEELSNELEIHKGLIVIEKIATPHGKQIASGIARIYGSRKDLEEYEPEYLLERTGILDMEVDEEEMEDHEEAVEKSAEESKSEELEEEEVSKKELEEPEEAEEEEKEPEEIIDYQDLSNETISEIKEKSEDLDLDYEKLLEAEKENKDRKTLKEWLNRKIE